MPSSLRRVSSPDAPTRAVPLLGLGGLLAAFLVVGVGFRPTAAGERFDGRGLTALAALRHDPWFPWTAFAHLGDPWTYAVCCLGLLVVAARRGDRRWMVAVPLTMLGSELTAQALKQLLAVDRPVISAAARVSDAAWPSGHSTAVMTVALLAIVLAPVGRRRPVAGGALALVVLAGIGIVADGFHYPTDVLGGFLWAAVWVTAAVIIVGPPVDPAAGTAGRADAARGRG